MGVARQFHTQQIHFLRKDCSFSDNGSTLAVGTLPAGSVILKPLSGVNVSTVFSGGGAPTLNIGTAASGAFFASALSLTTVGHVSAATANSFLIGATDTDITAAVTASGNTAGVAQIVIAYIPNL